MRDPLPASSPRRLKSCRLSREIDISFCLPRAVPAPTTGAAYMYAPQADHQQPQQPPPPPPPPSQTYGVSFTGTAKFAPLPFPPCEHRLPPPSTSTGTRVPPFATIQHGVLLPQQQQHPPPPPSYTESCTSSSGNVVGGVFDGGALAHTPSPSSAASTLLFSPTPASPPPPTSASSLLHHLALPFVPQVAASPSPAPPSSAGATPNFVLVSVPAPPAPPPAAPVPVFLSTSSGMVPYGHHAPISTPWPPVPLRHIDSYLAGTWPLPPPPPALQQVVHVPNQNTSHPATGTAQQQPPQFKTDLVTFPVQFGGGGGGGSPGSSQAVPTQTVLATSSVLGGMLTPSHGTPLAASSPEKTRYPETTAPAPAPATATVPAPPLDAQCQVQGCQAHSFCQLSPCHCRICRDHLGWVMRGVRIVDAETGVEIEPDKSLGGEVETETKKMYRCIACGCQSAAGSGGAGGGGGTLPSKRTGQPQHRKALSDESGIETTTTTTTTAANDDAKANTFSIHYFSHGPVSHPQPQPQLQPRPEPQLPTQLQFAFSTALDPMGDAASLVVGPHVPLLHPSAADQPYGLEAGHQVGLFYLSIHTRCLVRSESTDREGLMSFVVQYMMHEMFAARQEALNPPPSVASSYPISTQATLVESTAKQVAPFEGEAKVVASPPRTAEREKAEPLEVVTASLPPRCRSAIGSPSTWAGSPETDTTQSPLQIRSASSPSTLETAVTTSPPQGSAAPHSPPKPPASPPSPCRTPSPASTSPFYTQAHGGYGNSPSPPITRDDPYPFGYDAPYFGGSRSSSYPPFGSPYEYGPTAESGFLPTGSGPVQIPHGGLMREADLQQQQGMATPGLGLLGMPAPPLSSYVTPPRMSHRKRQSYAGKAGKASLSPSEKQHSPVAESGLASPAQQSPVRTFQLPPQVDGSSLEPREWPIVKIENVSRSSVKFPHFRGHLN